MSEPNREVVVNEAAKEQECPYKTIDIFWHEDLVQTIRNPTDVIYTEPQYIIKTAGMTIVFPHNSYRNIIFTHK
jgi:hypothetical protein